MLDPGRARRIRIVGISGSGKTRLGAQVAALTGLAHLELDAVFWQADWQFRDVEEARDLVRAFADAHPEGWVADGNWISRLDGLLDPGTPGGADEMVWLDHSRLFVMQRVVGRTLRRGFRREELWHGNRERPSTWLRNTDENIIRWAWTQHRPTRERMLQRIDGGLPVVRLSGQREVDAWLARIRSSTRAP